MTSGAPRCCRTERRYGAAVTDPLHSPPGTRVSGWALLEIDPATFSLTAPSHVQLGVGGPRRRRTREGTLDRGVE